MLTLILLLILAGIIILSGLLLLLRPAVLIRLSSLFNKVVINTDTAVLAYRWLWGMIFMLAGIYLFYVAFTN
ncbi:MAG: hypothetical protein IID16_08870 [Candidatus Marinimicrobia bacterium]|nr:hypothetical protein [Candidatus Neomarinimicrobiota bacterium]